MVKINFSSAIKAATKNEKNVNLHFEGTFGELLLKLKSIYGDVFAKRILVENKVKQYVNIYINGKDYRYLNLESTQIFDSDEIDFIPSVSGG